MKCLNIFVIFIILIINSCSALTCEEVKNIYSIELESNCCDLQYFTCDSSKENILSIDVLSLKEDIKNNQLDDEPELEEENMNKLFARKVKKSHSKSKHHSNNEDNCYNYTFNGTAIENECNSAQSIQITTLICVISVILTTMVLFK
eukprot:jgi/Orpsp1_1/1186789/evm.model.d7180000053324.1